MGRTTVANVTYDGTDEAIRALRDWRA
jgi:hypothetical protein